jgi:protein-tyrosine phosphatase
MSSNRSAAELKTKDETFERFVKLRPSQIPSDFQTASFDWTVPGLCNAVPGLPIYIGKGCQLPFASLVYPISSERRDQLAHAAFNFYQHVLQTVKADFVIAINKEGYFEGSGYVGLHNWSASDDDSFFQKSPFDKNIKFLLYQDEHQAHWTIIVKKTAERLVHWQLFQNDKLQHSAHILNIMANDGCCLDALDEATLKILHDMIGEAFEDKKNLYNHCAAGVGRSAITTLAELMYFQLRSSQFNIALLHNLPGLNEDNYLEKIVSWAHKNVRTGMLGGGDPLTINYEQLICAHELAIHLVESDLMVRPRIKMAERVRLTNADTAPILRLVLEKPRQVSAASDQVSANASSSSQKWQAEKPQQYQPTWFGNAPDPSAMTVVDDSSRHLIKGSMPSAK